MKRDLTIEVVYPDSPERVWRALTDTKALSEWLIENNEMLTSRGVKFMSPPTRQGWGRQAIFEDLYGNQYALMGK